MLDFLSLIIFHITSCGAPDLNIYLCFVNRSSA